MTDKDDLNILMSLQFYAIGKCDKHNRYYKENTSNIIIKVSEIGYKGNYYKSN